MCLCKGGSEKGYTIGISWALDKLLLALAVSKKKKKKTGREGEWERRRTRRQNRGSDRLCICQADLQRCVKRWVMMSSPCLCRTMPVSQSQLPEVKLSLKTSREVSSIRSSTYSSGKDLPIRVSTQATRSRSTPPVSRVQCTENKAAPKTNGYTKHEPKNFPERNSTSRRILPAQASSMGSASSSSSSSSSSSYTSRLSRPSPPQKPSSSSSSSSQSMKRTRWLSHSTSNIYFHSILDGRFRQLQGRLFWLHPLPLSPSLRQSGPSPAMFQHYIC
ncbi:uncharacterized protein Hap1MRO34_015332 [Clarias gariepinus]